MSIKITTDSSSDLTSLDGVEFSYAPLKIIAGEREFIDSAELDTEKMLSFLEKHEGKSSTSCPNVADWRAAFLDADEIFAVTITSKLSGSYNAARLAAEEHCRQKPGRRVHVIDTLSVGPESILIIEKLRELILGGESFDKIEEKIAEYNTRTRLIFALESMHNLVNNGRVSPLSAKMAGILGIRAIGRASDVGTLEMTDKVRGERGMVKRIFENMIKDGYLGGSVRIDHVKNEPAARLLEEAVLKNHPEADIKIREARGLCSFYAERGGLLVGFES